MDDGYELDTVERSGERRLLGLLAILCGVLMAIGAAIPIVTGEQRAAAPIVLGDVAQAHLVEIRDQRGQTVLSGEFRSHVDAAGNTEKDAALVDRQGKSVIGEVELEIPAPGRTNRRPELEVDILGLPARATFTVVVDDRTVGAFTTDDRGGVDMELLEGEVPPQPAGM